MLTIAAVSELLALSESAVRAHAKAGRLPSYRFGRAVRFDPRDVEAFKASCRSAGTPETSAGDSSSTVTLQVSGTELADYFRAAGLKPRQTPSTAKKAPDSRPLRLVSQDQPTP